MKNQIKKFHIGDKVLYDKLPYEVDDCIILIHKGWEGWINLKAKDIGFIATF